MKKFLVLFPLLCGLLFVAAAHALTITATVAWTVGTAAGHTSWSVQKTTDGGAPVEVGTTAAATTQFVDSTLTVNHTYTYAIAACNTFGCGAYTAPVSTNTNAATGVPSGVIVTTTTSP